MSETTKGDGTYQTPGGDAVTNIGWANATKVLVDRDEFERIVENSQRAEGRAWRACGVEESTIPRDHDDWPVAMEYARLVLPRWIVERIETQRWSGDYLRSALDSARRAYEHMIEIGWYKEHPDEMRDEKETDALGRFAADRVVKLETTVAALTAENAQLRETLTLGLGEQESVIAGLRAENERLTERLRLCDRIAAGLPSSREDDRWPD